MLIPLLLIVVAAVVAYWIVVQANRARSVTATRGETGRQDRTLQQARWRPTHRQADGRTEVVLQRVIDDADGGIEVVEERPFDSWPDDDPMWEARFAEAMTNARHRCEVMNSEEDPGTMGW